MAVSDLTDDSRQVKTRKGTNDSDMNNLDYGWMEPPRARDPIVTDTNLAEIDFEEFRNEDLAYAFSCGEEESGGSSTDMSICRSEALFSSMRDSSGPANLLQTNPNDASLLHESLAGLNYSDQVKVNKNNYTLTFSSHAGVGTVGSLIASIGATAEVVQSPGNLVTWSNLGKTTTQKSGNDVELERSGRKEEENNNNGSSGDHKLVDAFVKSKDNDSRLTSIQEASGGVEDGKTSSSGTSSSFDRTQSERRTSAAITHPDLSFLENDVGLWDAFFLHGKNKSPSVLKQQPLPVEEYLRRRRQQQRPSSNLVRDADSLRTLLPAAHRHLLDSNASSSGRESPITQVCESLSRLHSADRQAKQNLQNQAIKSLFSPQQKDVRQVGRVKEAWTTNAEPTRVEVVKRRSKKNLNAINNNDDVDDLTSKRRSYHPQEYLSKVLDQNCAVAAQPKPKTNNVPKSGSVNNLCDSGAEVDGSFVPTPSRTASAEYPFHANLCLPSQSINFDLTHKRGLFVTLYSSVERLLSYHGGADSNDSVSSRCILFHELCPALHAVMADGLKPEVITSFGKMSTSVWRVVEAVTRHGPSAGTATCDLLMLLNTRVGSGQDEKKFAGFAAGLIDMSYLHIWFSKLKWSMDVLLRFYERHAFICALHKETRLLFDEFIVCLQRLYSVPIKVELPFVNPDFNLDDLTTRMAKNSDCTNCGSASRASSSTSGSCSAVTRRSSAAKSRIPRPVSLPNRLEAKLGGGKAGHRVSSKSRGRKSKGGNSPTTTTVTKAPLLPAGMGGGGSGRKSRVRDTIRLFDAKSPSRIAPANAKVWSGGHDG